MAKSNKPSDVTPETTEPTAVEAPAKVKPDPTPAQVLTRVLGCGLGTANAMLTGTDEATRAKILEIYKGNSLSKATEIRQLFNPKQSTSA